MSKLLLYFAHPNLNKSLINKELSKQAKKIDHLHFQDLYEKYPRFNIDVDKEQQLLIKHDFIIFQFPIFWYSSPSLVKEWLDLVLEHGFAYGKEGNRLCGKHFMLAVSAGAPLEAYSPRGIQNYSLRDFLRPFEQTARLCKMKFIPPYVLFSSLNMHNTVEFEEHSKGFETLLQSIVNDTFDTSHASKLEFITYQNIPLK